MEAKIIFNEIYGERELVVNNLWNWIHKYSIYNRVIARKKYTLIKGAENYEILLEDFKESDLEDIVKTTMMYSKTDLNNFFDKNENIDEILIPVNVIVDGEMYKYTVGLYRDGYKDIYPVVKVGYIEKKDLEKDLKYI